MKLHRQTGPAPDPQLQPFNRLNGIHRGTGNHRLRHWPGYLVYIVLLLSMFAKPLFSLAVYAARSDLHSHILLIPLISGYLLYLRRNQLPNDYSSSPALAILPLIAGLSALYFAWQRNGSPESVNQNDYPVLISFSFISLLIAGGFLFLGRKWMASAAFPFGFLVFMIPLPDSVVYNLETASKLASAEVAGLLFAITGTPVYRDNLVFQLPGIAIQVAQECSGIRSSWVLFITGILAAQLFLNHPWRRTILIGAVIPLGILRNGFRILVIGILCVHKGPQMIHSVIHQRGGPFFFVISLIPLFALLWWLHSGEIIKSRKRI